MISKGKSKGGRDKGISRGALKKQRRDGDNTYPSGGQYNVRLANSDKTDVDEDDGNDNLFNQIEDDDTKSGISQILGGIKLPKPRPPKSFSVPSSPAATSFTADLSSFGEVAVIGPKIEDDTPMLEPDDEIQLVPVGDMAEPIHTKEELESAHMDYSGPMLREDEQEFDSHGPKRLEEQIRRRYSTTSTIYADNTINNPNCEELLFW